MHSTTEPQKVKQCITGTCSRCGGPCKTTSKLCKKCHNSRRSEKWVPKTCTICGESFDTKNENQKCCSAECANVQSHGSRVERSERDRTHKCLRCGETFVAKRPDRDTFCSRECAFAWRKGNPILGPQLPEKPKPECKCKFCGADCPPGRRTLCSDECANELRIRQLIEKNPGYYGQRKCKVCGQIFDRGFKYSLRGFCSDECREVARKKTKRECRRRAKKKYGSAFNQRGKRAVQRHWGDDWKAHYQRINRDKVLKRDNMRCQLCGIKLKRSKKFRGDQASVDHIVPLSMGGDHTYANVQACCMKCNSEKSDSIAGQLRLF